MKFVVRRFMDLVDSFEVPEGYELWCEWRDWVELRLDHPATDTHSRRVVLPEQIEAVGFSSLCLVELEVAHLLGHHASYLAEKKPRLEVVR